MTDNTALLPARTTDRRHGGAYDRGAADRYYDRPQRPHYFEGRTGVSRKITDLTQAEIDDYRAGYREQDDRKDWR